MAVVGTAELLANPTAEFDKLDAKFQKRYRVITDSVNDAHLTVLRAAGLPQYLDPWELGDDSHSGARATKASVENPAPFIWIITYDYTLPQNSDQASPLDVRPTLDISSFEIVIPVMGIVEGNDFTYTDGLRNSAGEIFIPPPEMPLAGTTLTFTRYEDIATPIMSIKRQYENTTNSSSYWGWDSGYALLSEIGAAIEWLSVDDAQIPFWHVTYVVRFNPLGWDLQLLDQGSWYFDDDDRKVTFKTDDGQPMVGRLDGDGGLLDEGEDSVFLTRQIFPQSNFGLLGLPNSQFDCI